MPNEGSPPGEPVAAHMHRAIELASASVAAGGGPFGAVVVRDGEVLAEAANRVVLDRDPTAHAEINALRAAARRLGTHELYRCEVYSSCEPCPMCLGALVWARVGRVWFAASRSDAAEAGFDDQAIYDEVGRPLDARRLPIAEFLRAAGRAPFDAWKAAVDKTLY